LRGCSDLWNNSEFSSVNSIKEAFMKKALSVCSLVSFVILVSPTEAAAQDRERTYFHPKLQAKETLVNRLVILPPAVDVSKQGVKGQEGMGQESEKATANFSTEVVAALRERGASVENPFTEEALKGDDELRSALADVQRRFDDVASKMFNKKKDVKKGRFSLGDGVAVLNSKGDEDALVIVRAVGTQETTGKAIMKRGLVGMALTHGKIAYHSRVALVDARNGDVLFLGDYDSWGSPGTKLLQKSFKKLPVKTE
jgi:hypothetical protein